MRSLARSLTLGAALVLLVLPAWAQDDEPAAPANNEPAPAAESATAGASGAATGPSRRALLRAWHAKRQAALALKEQQAALRESAARNAAAAPAPSPEPAHAATKLDSGALDSHPLDTLPGAGPAEAVRPAEHPAVPTEHAAPRHGETAHGAATPGANHGEAHGGEPGEPAAFSVKTFILQLINFGVLLFLLIYFGGRAMNKALRARHELLKTEISEASRLREEAKQKFEAQAKRMAELEQEIAALRKTMRKEAEREQARLLESARERGKAMQADMRAQIDEQVKVAEAALRAEVASASIALAEELARKAVGFDDERRLAREFVASFAEKTGSDGEAR